MEELYVPDSQMATVIDPIEENSIAVIVFKWSFLTKNKKNNKQFQLYIYIYEIHIPETSCNKAL